MSQKRKVGLAEEEEGEALKKKQRQETQGLMNEVQEKAKATKRKRNVDLLDQ